MDNLIIYNDKSETFRFKLTLEGAKLSETFSRLCLEFDNGDNLYFKGRISPDGICSVDIPSLKKYEGNGIAKIEVVAESTYFQIHEMSFEIKKKIEAKLESIMIDDQPIHNSSKKPEIRVEYGTRLTEIKTVETPKQEPIESITSNDNNKTVSYSAWIKKK